MLQQRNPSSCRKHVAALIASLCCLLGCGINWADAAVFFTQGSSYGYLAAVAMPLNLPNREVYVAFNFESNYGLPTNNSYNEWIDRWDLDETYLGIGNNVTVINGRQLAAAARTPRYSRSTFYRSFVGYMQHFGMNGTACLLRTICEVAASTLDEHNGLLGGIFKILFMPSTSAPEQQAETMFAGMHEAELQGGSGGECEPYAHSCPEGFIDMISVLL